MSVCGIVLAAGRGVRMGGTPKQLLPLDGRPLLQHVIDAAASAGVEALVVVLGHAADRARRRRVGPAPPPPSPSPQPPYPQVTVPRSEAEASALLGLPRGAAPDEVERAYREQVSRCHPDRVAGLHPAIQGQAEGLTVALNAARDLLLGRSPRRRAQRASG